MYKKQRKNLKSFLNLDTYNDDVFSRNSMNTIIRALLEPVANHNTNSILFSRIKNKEGLEGLIKRLEYCTNVEMTDVLEPGIIKRDDYVELEFLIFTSARYNFALIWDYSTDKEKNYTKSFFLANSRCINDIFEILQENMYIDYREKFYLHKPERRDNELLNEAMFNVFKKLNNSIEEGGYDIEGDLIVDLEDESEEKIREISHEIKNELSILDIYTTILEKELGKNKNLDVIKKSTSMIAFHLNRLKHYDSREIEEINIRDLLLEAIQMTEGVVNINNNKIKLSENNQDYKIFGNYDKLLSVLLNIIKNGSEATKNDEISVEFKEENNILLIDIKNHGEKINETVASRIFEKGYTTKQEGTGYGLYSSKRYLKELRGDITLLSSDENETIFRISLPTI